jgi:hypothetical protein
VLRDAARIEASCCHAGNDARATIGGREAPPGEGCEEGAFGTIDGGTEKGCGVTRAWLAPDGRRDCAGGVDVAPRGGCELAALGGGADETRSGASASTAARTPEALGNSPPSGKTCRVIKNMYKRRRASSCESSTRVWNSSGVVA